MDTSSGLSFARSAIAQQFIALARDGWRFGWHEANGGNLSYLLSAHDVETEQPFFAIREDAWVPLAHPVPALGNAYLLVSAAGCYFKNMDMRAGQCAGVVEIDGRGRCYRCLCGFDNGGQPTSELGAHLLVHASQAAQAHEVGQVVYHAHTPYTVALSAALAPHASAWDSVLSQAFTEYRYLLPEGVAVLPRMEPGSASLAEQTAQALTEKRACVWQNHGIIVRATAFDEAYGMVHTIEKAAKIVLAAPFAFGLVERA